MEYSKLPDMRAASAPDGPCIADADTSLSNNAFFARVLSAAGAFSDYGVGPGDVVALMLPNQVEFVVAMFAAWRLGAAITPINPGSTRPEASYQILDSHAKLLINITGESVAETVPALSADTLKDHPPSSAVPVADPAAPALLIYPSGPTGKPKNVIQQRVLLRWNCFGRPSCPPCRPYALG